MLLYPASPSSPLSPFFPLSLPSSLPLSLLIHLSSCLFCPVRNMDCNECALDTYIITHGYIHMTYTYLHVYSDHIHKPNLYTFQSPVKLPLYIWESSFINPYQLQIYNHQAWSAEILTYSTASLHYCAVVSTCFSWLTV